MKKAILNTLFLTLLVSCGSTKEETAPLAFQGQAMTMDYTLLIGKKKVDLEKIEAIIAATFSEIDAIYNKWNPNSEVSQLNCLKAYEKKVLSPALELFLKETKTLSLLTEGRFDPTILPLENLWKKAFALNKIPAPEEIQETLLAVGLDKIVIEEGIFYKTHDQTSLDLGAIAKGFAVDLLTLKLNAAGYEDVFVEWGGEIKATGEHPDMRPWHIFIRQLHNQKPEDAIAHVDLKNEAIATSGDYLQNWTLQEKDIVTIYTHIFDPKTGYPLEVTRRSIGSASVKHSSCFIADALATALMLFEDKISADHFAERLRLKIPDMQWWIMSRESNEVKR